MAMFTNYKYLYIPANLNVEELCVKYTGTEYTGITPDKLAFLCHSLIQVSTKYRNQSDETNGFVPLYSLILRSKIQNYHVCKQLLIDAEVIQCNEKYCVGEKSKEFRFCDKYFGTGLKKYAIDPKAFQKYKAVNPKNVIQYKLNSRANHLIRFLDPENLKLDKKKAYQYLEESRRKHLQELQMPSFHGIYLSLEDSINNRYDKYEMIIDQFEESCTDYNIDSSGFRFFTVLTNLKKELRNFITYDSKPLVSLDFKCSQPYLSLILFNSHFYSSDLSKESVTLKKIYPELYEHLRTGGYLKKLKQIASNTETLATNVSDVKEYRNSIIDKDYYTSLSNVISAETGILLPRSEAKEQSHYIFFGDPKRMNWAGGYKAFKKVYPTVASVLKILKSRNYRDLAILLQRIESDLVINKITKQFVKILPTVPIYTIHDSLITVQDFTQELVNISNQLAIKYFRVPPKFEYEEWTESKALDNIDKIKFSKAERKLIRKIEHSR